MRLMLHAVMLSVALSLLTASAQAETFTIAEDSDIVGSQQSTASRHEDTLPKIARQFDLGYNQITRANPDVDPWLPGEGTRIVLPTQYILPNAPRQGIVLNLAEMRLYYFPASQAQEAARVTTHPVGIGRQGWETPTGQTKVMEKIIDPKWLPPASIKTEHAERGDILTDVVPAGPENPLGHRALRLAAWSDYLIHGTNKPYGIGMPVSHGCIRLYPEDIESLFEQVSVGTPVRIVNQPYKAGWHHGMLYLQAYPTLSGKPELTKAIQAVVSVTQEQENMVDWEKVVETAREASGFPTPISK